ncbi:MAG: putative TIM-barrel fold metal-dependent hydrolase [Pseudohongiellaceae bacterium]|jgi:predicted TIM-barrel fold metal-dependent hydrolase
MKRLLALTCALALICAVSLTGCVSWLGGASSREPEEAPAGLSAEARALVQAAYADVEPEQLMDYHTHLVGLGTDSDAFVHPHMQSWWHPIARLKFAVYASAARIEDLERADQQFVERLTRLVRAIPRHGRHLLLGFDRNHDTDGEPDLELSEFYTPNAYAFRVAEGHPDLFVPAISIHPYREDAVEQLELWAARGARVIKWLPNAMGIDPADSRVDPFYAAMLKHDMILLTHAGEERAVDADEAQKLGNPLRLRRPLDLGVTVVVAHCASLGTNEDLDDPELLERDNLELFLRLMDEPRYEGLLFGEISALTQANRLPQALAALLRRTDLHPRLVNGSDYPLPAVNVVIRMGALEGGGFLSEVEAELLEEIYDFNPLMFDYVLKRTVRAPDTGEAFAPEVFLEHPKLVVFRPSAK